MIQRPIRNNVIKQPQPNPIDYHQLLQSLANLIIIVFLGINLYFIIQDRKDKEPPQPPVINQTQQQQSAQPQQQ